MLRRLTLLLAAACVLGGCGEEAAGDGSARLWVTRDRGSEVMLSTTVPAGISAMEALRREADVETRYGGRFVHSIEGVEGDIAEQHDWFWFLNGYEADLSAVDYTLHDGDVLWWDHRSWEGRMRQPVVVGAFPEPFLHGWRGERRQAAVRFVGDARVARRVAHLIGADSVEDFLTPVAPGANVLFLAHGSAPPEFNARLRSAAASPGAPVRMLFVGDPRALLRTPSPFRYRYEVP